MRFVFLLTVLFASVSVQAGNVIFVTLDGVRVEEFFGGVRMPERAGLPEGTVLFPGLFAAEAFGDAWFFGGDGNRGSFRIGNRSALSLPGYRALLTGDFETTCRGNGCANVDRETIFDGLVDRGFVRGDLAAFASWAGVGRALEREPGRIVRDVEHAGGYLTENPSSDERTEIERVLETSRRDLPAWGARRDTYTYALGKLYLRSRRPKFLYLSFLDSDEFAHENRYRDYVESLRRYDRWIAELRAMLAGMGDYGADTSIVVTTDHGRGRGFLWTSHSREFSNAYRTWAAVIPAENLKRTTKGRRSAPYSQLDVRPTLEVLLGVDAKSGAGRPLIERSP